MKLVRFLVDNSTTVLGLLTAAFGLLSTFGLEVTSEQVGGVMLFAGAVIALLGKVVTIPKRTAVAVVDAAGVIRAGAASTATTGSATPVQTNEAGDLVPQVAVKSELLN